jgi:hypothetical protein
MLNLFSRDRVSVSGCIPLAAGIAFVGMLAVVGAAPSRAESSSWEIGCSQTTVTPGNGDILREMNCSRQKDCQIQANRFGMTTYSNGCVGVAPSVRHSQPKR